MTDSLLWEIKNPNDNKSSYIFGTIHVYDPEIFIIPAAVYHAVSTVDIFALEADASLLSHEEIVSRITTDDPERTLDKLFDDDTYRKIKEATGNIDDDILKRYKPLFITSLILNHYGYSRSVDEELRRYASHLGKQIVGLESVDEQIDAVDDVSPEEQVDIIVKSFMNESDPVRDLIKMMKYYKDQNFKEIVENMKSTSIPETFTESIQLKRNIRMSDRISEIISSGKSVFAAVGAMHLPDVDDTAGMIGLMKQKGYDLIPVAIELRNPRKYHTDSSVFPDEPTDNR